MKITAKNIIKHELIGLKTVVVESKNKCLIGLAGEIIWETAKMIVIRRNKKINRIPKDICKFLLYLPNGEKVIVEGKILIGRPEKRIKKVIRMW